MTPQQKSAYRYLLYVAMLDIRTYCQWSSDESDDPKVWREQYRSARFAGGIAYWLHNLALAAADDFDGFNEDAFWMQHVFFCKRFPQAGLERYRTQFDQRLAAKLLG
jgi:hypothetical protein